MLVGDLCEIRRANLALIFQGLLLVSTNETAKTSNLKRWKTYQSVQFDAKD